MRCTDSSRFRDIGCLDDGRPLVPIQVAVRDGVVLWYAPEFNFVHEQWEALRTPTKAFDILSTRSWDWLTRAGYFSPLSSYAASEAAT